LIQSPALGIDVGGTKTALALVDCESGVVVRALAIATEAHESANSLRLRLAAPVAELRAEADSDDVPLGICVPEIVDPSGEITTDGVIPGLSGDLRARWSDLGISCVNSDVRSAAIAEATYGAGTDAASLLYVSVGTGLSHTLVVRGRAWPGANGAALVSGSGQLVRQSELPHLTSDVPLESVASGPGLVAWYVALGGTATKGEEVLRLAGSDPRARVAAEGVGEVLGKRIGDLVNILDPHMVVLGGGLGAATGPHRDRLEVVTRATIWSDQAAAVVIRGAALGPYSAVIGAAALARAQVWGDMSAFAESG
jgi:glucokinase